VTVLSDLKAVLDKVEHAETADFVNAARSLLDQQFLFVANPRQRTHYHLVTGQIRYFTDLFEALGWSLHWDRDFGFVGIVPDDNESYLALKQDETLILLVLRLLYEEGIEKFEAEDGCVWVDSDEILNRYEVLARRVRPGVTRYREIIALFSRHHLVNKGDAGDLAGLPRLQLLPSLRCVTSPNVLERLEALANTAADDVRGNSEEEGQDA
jgi:hypothetical protein